MRAPTKSLSTTAERGDCSKTQGIEERVFEQDGEKVRPGRVKRRRELIFPDPERLNRERVDERIVEIHQAYQEGYRCVRQGSVLDWIRSGDVEVDVKWRAPESPVRPMAGSAPELKQSDP
jgi:hypothetical protein